MGRDRDLSERDWYLFNIYVVYARVPAGNR